MESYGLGLDNLTALDQSRSGVVSQKNAFTVVDASLPNVGIKGEKNENILVTGFTIIGIRKQWRYRLLRWLASRLAGERATDGEKPRQKERARKRE